MPLVKPAEPDPVLAIATAPVPEADRMLLDLIERFKFRGKLPRGKPPGMFAAEVHEYLEAAGVSKLRISEIIESAAGRGVIGRAWVSLKNGPSGCFYSNGEEMRALYKSRRDYFIPAMKKLGWDLNTPEATFYVWARTPKGLSSMEVASMTMLGCEMTSPNQLVTVVPGITQPSLRKPW